VKPHPTPPLGAPLGCRQLDIRRIVSTATGESNRKELLESMASSCRHRGDSRGMRSATQIRRGPKRMRIFGPRLAMSLGINVVLHRRDGALIRAQSAPAGTTRRTRIVLGPVTVQLCSSTVGLASQLLAHETPVRSRRHAELALKCGAHQRWIREAAQLRDLG
jgi:hypothetical protein